MNSAEPIAIVGVACRFAGGVDSPDKLWSLLRAGGDTIGELPDGRWDWYASQGRGHAAVVRDVPKRGAYLDDVQGFDADFFDVTPREAALMDPQQRIVLELAWEALEHAGISPLGLGGSDAGVFMGVGADDYGRRQLENLPDIEAWTGIGSAYCAVANRVSYHLDLRGPSMVVDTACSSSLVATHLAVQALRAGECPLALVGGVHVMAAPGLSVVLDAAGATARDGRSKSFDAGADGYGRGEGGGVVVLKRLSDARRDGDRVLAVIRGSGVHQDGRTNGIMAPNGEAQAHLMRRTYEAAGIDPATVSYVEAHGTGTPLGDLLEAGAMASVFGAGRPTGRPCLIGSVKPNIGHLEAGAGVAGVIKAVLALHHGEIPPNVGLRTPNPAIAWDTSGLRVVTEPTPWPRAGEPRRAGVSGYGYGGTIAHVILEEADRPATRTEGDRGPALYPLSGASLEAVQQYAGRLADRLADDPGVSTADVGHTLAHRRAHLPHRAAVFAADREQLVARLRELAGAGTESATGRVLPATGRGLVWVFSGHGSQWTGMARELLARDAVFAEVIDRLEPIFNAEMGLSPRAAILDDEPQPVDVVQPMIFALQVGLGAVWRACGVRPDAVVGHSVGEIAAAVTAGALTLEQGARLVCRRSVLLRQVLGKGAMSMVNLTPDEAARRLGDRRDVAVAVAAAAHSAVISGDIPAVAEVSRQWQAEGLTVRPVASDVAFHSPHMDPLLDDLATAAADLPPRPPAIPLYSTALADPRSTAPRDGAYWAANLGRQVRFAQAVTAAAEDGYRLFLEVSPHPVVEHSINETLDALGIEDAYATHTLRRNRPERETLLANLGSLYCHGLDVDWSALWPDGTLADLPTTAWRHRPYWTEDPASRSFLTGQHDPAGHTVLGGRINVYGTTPAHAWLTYLDHDSRPYPGRHPVREVEIIPAAVLLNSFLAAAAATGPWPDLTDVALRVPVSLTQPRYLQVVVQDDTVRLSSRIADDTASDTVDHTGWLTHTTAAIEAHSGTRAPRASGRAAAEREAVEELPTGFVIDRLAELGVAAMGFPWVVEDLRRGPGSLVATVRADGASDSAPGSAPDGAPEGASDSASNEAPEGASDGASDSASGDAPATWAAILDAALSTASVVFPGPPILRMPAHIDRVTLSPGSPARARITARVTGENVLDVEITDLDGVVLGRLDGLRYGVLDGDAGAVASPRRLVHQIAWRPLERTGTAEVPNLVVVGPESALLSRLTGGFGLAGVPYRTAARPDDLPDDELTGDSTVLVVPPPGLAGDVGESAVRASWLLARTAQRLAETGLTTPARLWCVTEGVREGAGETGLGQGPLWGLGRIIGGEHPELWGGVVDLGTSPADVFGLLDVLRSVRGEDVVAVRNGEVTVPRLCHVDGEPVRPPAACRPEGTYLITGGLGALGLEVAHWLAARGMRRIVLTGRTALPSRDLWDEVTDPETLARITAIRSLERLGVTVVTVALDIADAVAAAKLLSPAALGLPPIRGVVHAAGVLDNRMLRNLDQESLRTVLRPKVDGALVLHELFPPGSVDFFVLFSSCGQLLGLPGQASYAAGNAFLDVLAAHRRALGDSATTSFGWTSWRGLGMSTSSAAIDIELAARGTADVSPTEAFGAWELAERYDLDYAAVLRTIPLEPGDSRPPLLSELPVAAPAEEAAGEPSATPWAGLRGDELHAVLVQEIGREVAAVTKLSTGEVNPRKPLAEMGLDSVMTGRIRRVLERRFRLQLPATLLWDRPTIDAVASLLVERLEEDT
ncbi:type I polyketide synthase [Nonomuraea jiangxiensis]|uniref:6-methylsalicylic acid synthase n=1 Tax=Nonomuraea jiangxiensis TaxID=633440 RepID=A0A1G8IDF2_9ACTN|nr:type I polyketide synthase [Nonomuraea jiangxiensis]SDI17048.1 6-methylsalicylic acid synthase [Nonomuraea jiangxiensis]